MAVAIPVALYVLSLWVVHYRPAGGPHIAIGPIAVVLILQTPLAGLIAIPLIGIVLSALVWFKISTLPEATHVDH